jgi:hypothetical protein
MFQNDGYSGKIRMLPISGAARTATVPQPGVNPSARGYTSTANGTVDALDADASVIASEGFYPVCPSGPTASRPNNAYLRPGFQYIDTDLSLLIVWDGGGVSGAWRNPVTGAAV